jgi:hypothetical protein
MGWWRRWRRDRKLQSGQAEITIGSNWGHNPGPKTIDMGDISGYKYECPQPVNKNNWLGRDQWGDRFKIDDLGDGKFKATREDTGNSASGWGMNLRVACKRTIRDGFFEITIGSNHGHNPGAKKKKPRRSIKDSRSSAPRRSPSVTGSGATRTATRSTSTPPTA